MRKKQQSKVAEFTLRGGGLIFVDMSRVEAIQQHEDSKYECLLLTGSESYLVQMSAVDATQIWKEVL